MAIHDTIILGALKVGLVALALAGSAVTAAAAQDTQCYHDDSVFDDFRKDAGDLANTCEWQSAGRDEARAAGASAPKPARENPSNPDDLLKDAGHLDDVVKIGEAPSAASGNNDSEPPGNVTISTGSGQAVGQDHINPATSSYEDVLVTHHAAIAQAPWPSEANQTIS